jgi:hypothetical protein
VTCQKFQFLQETACTFGDGSGEVITADSVSHHSAEQWTKEFPALVKADAEAEANMVKTNEEVFTRLAEESAKEQAAQDAEIAEDVAQIRLTHTGNKKPCVRAGYVWQHNACVSKESK